MKVEEGGREGARDDGGMDDGGAPRPDGVNDRSSKEVEYAMSKAQRG